MPTPSSSSKAQEPANSSSSRLLRTLKRTNAPPSPSPSAPRPSKGKGKAVDKDPLAGAASTAETRISKPSSSHKPSTTERHASEPRIRRHRTSPVVNPPTSSTAATNSKQDVPSLQSSHKPSTEERHASEPRIRRHRTSPVVTYPPTPSTAATNSKQQVPIIEVTPPKPPESTFLVQKIRGLIDSLPALSSRFLSSPKDPTILDSDGRPIPPPGAVRIQDPDLISLLSNPDVMNGSDGRRRSVWSMLQAIKPPSVESDENYEYVGSDRSSVMMYSPLIPKADSVIELAEVEDAPVPSGSSSGGWSFPSWEWSNLWPFSGWKTADVAVVEPALTSLLLAPDVSVPQTAAPTTESRVAPARRVWVPSTTELSFETTWWGYRIYLPPPVLAILDDQSVEAARQATTLTAALTWFFGNLPISTFPPPLQPAMILLQRLVPLVSYLGTFISWSWSTIRGFDRGHGVILTATWLLPIALIPGTWHTRDVPATLFSPPDSAAPAVISDAIAEAVAEPEPVMPPPPAPVVKPLPETPASPPPLKQRKSSSSSGKSKIKTLRKLTRTFTHDDK